MGKVASGRKAVNLKVSLDGAVSRGHGSKEVDRAGGQLEGFRTEVAVVKYSNTSVLIGK